MSSLLSQLAITGVIATSGAGLDAPPVPELTPQNVTADADAATDHDTLQRSSTYRVGGDNSSRQFDNDQRVPVGIDISSHQHKGGSRLDVREVVAGGQDFAFVKATEGTHYINPHFRPDVVNFIEEDTPVGFYHYARPSADVEDARQEAQFFVKVTGMDIGVKSLPPVLDIEEHEGLSPQQLTNWTHAFVDEIKHLTGRDTMIYTYPYFWQNHMGNTPEFNHLPLWIAHYTDSDKPGPLPGGWDEWTFWQHTDRGTIDGAVGRIDQNQFAGTMRELHELYVGSRDGHVIENASVTPSASASSGSLIRSTAAPQVSVIEEIEILEPQVQEVEIPGVTQAELPEWKTLLETFEE